MPPIGPATLAPVSAFEAIRAEYDGVESVFEEGEAASYRAAALAKTQPQARFIAERMAGSMIEVGCGNGRLLIALRQAGVIRSGLGVDIAESRVAFAQQWAGDLGLTGIEFRAGGALTMQFPEAFGGGACITGAFGYFDAYLPGSGRRLLQKLRSCTLHGAVLVLELYQHPAELRLIEAGGGLARTWNELPPSDPWRYYLSELSLDGSVLVHRKTFVHRTEGTVDEGRSERVAIYSPAEVQELCSCAGFADVQMFEGWTGEAYAGGGTMVVTAAAA